MNQTPPTYARFSAQITYATSATQKRELERRRRAQHRSRSEIIREALDIVLPLMAQEALAGKARDLPDKPDTSQQIVFNCEDAHRELADAIADVRSTPEHRVERSPVLREAVDRYLNEEHPTDQTGARTSLIRKLQRKAGRR